jgi:serine/threonine protein kinase/tetratricopeptide (TPR) repeat protein
MNWRTIGRFPSFALGGPDMSTSTESLSGLFAGRYAIEREIGRGATAIVYLARDAETGRMVALKVLRDALLESRSVVHFLREIEHQQGLTHESVVPVLDSGEADGRPFIVLPYMDGGTLRTRLLRERQLYYADVIAIGTAVCEALAHAHTRGIVHRDVKPENILFAGGRAYLSDFGIARALERVAGDATTSTGIIRGTPAYVSPEQAGGLVEYDGRTDVYSLGCVLYEMIAGVQPFVGPTPQSVISQRLSYRPTPVSQFRETVPVDLEAVVSRSMMVTPADRYQSAAEMLEALRSAGTEPSDPTLRTRVKDGSRWKIVALAVTTLAATAALVISLWPDPPAPGVIPEGDARRIAVLYMNSMTPDVLPEYVADGITEDLIDQLGAVNELHVISPDGVRPFRNDSVSLARIKNTLKVGTIVSGSIRRSGNMLRLSVRLTDAATQRQVDSNTLEAPWTELFDLQDRLAGQVEVWLRQRLGDQISFRANRAATSSLSSWEAVQLASREVRRAVQAAATRGDTSSVHLFLAADSMYKRASEFDPQWTLPLVRRGNLALLALAARSPVPPNGADTARYQTMPVPERSRLWVERAREMATLALARNPNDPHALALLGQADLSLASATPDRRDSLLASAERSLRTALEERPDNAPTWSALAELLVQRGRYGDAATAAGNAIEADPWFEVRRVLGIAFSASLAAEQFEDARKWCRQGLSYYPGDARFIECNLRILGSSSRSRSAIPGAWAEVAKIEAADSLRRLDATWGYRRLMVAAILARSGLHDSARAVMAAAMGQQPAMARQASRPAEAYLHLLLGDQDAAVQILSDYLHAMPPGSGAPILMHPWFVTVRGDSRLTSLAR